MDVEIKTMDLSFCGEVAQNVRYKESKEFILNSSTASLPELTGLIMCPLFFKKIR